MAAKRWTAVVALLLMVAGCSARDSAAPVSIPEPTGLVQVPAGVLRQLEAMAPGDRVEIDLLALTPGDVARVRQTVARLGGRTLETRAEERHLRAELPVAELDRLVKEAPLASLGLDRTLALEGTGPAQVAAPADNVARETALSGGALNFQAMRVPQFQRLQNATGTGVRIAVIDTGVDATHPALQQTPAGERKLIDWKDFTTEGVVRTDTAVRTETFTAINRQWNTGEIRSASGQLWFGVWEEFRAYGRIGRDLDRNGSSLDWWGVLVVDSTVPGVYDTVYVDLNRNGNFADETPVRIFRTSGQTFKLGFTGTRDQRAGFVVADVARDGKSVTFGFDGHGHGTQVAGTAAATEAGLAPGAQVMALKALRADGSGEWFHIQNAIRYAAENGAHIINVSVQDLVTAARFDSTASEWLNEIARRHGVLIVVAAGNGGPGLSSGATLGDASEILTIGAYFSPDIWERDWGYRLPVEGIWSRTGMGPRSDGTVVPSLVAPGSLPAVTPLWLSPTGYRIEEGTSIATPHVSGLAALLMDGARRAGVNSDYKSVKRALEMGARAITGYQIIEQGHGLVQADAAWDHLRRLDSQTQVRAHGPGGGSGLLARSFVPGSTEFRIQNLGGSNLRVGMVSLADWVQVGRQSLLVPAGGSRNLPVSYRPPATPGLHSAFIVLRESNHYGPDLWIPTTYVSPIPLNSANNYQHRVEGTIQAARYHRSFYQVMPGTGTLSVRTLVPGASEPAGRVQFFLFNPDGREVYRSPVLGAGSDRVSALAEIPNPTEGTWEVVVSSLPDILTYRPSDPASRFVLEAGATQIGVSPWPLKFAMAPGEVLTVPLQFSNQSSPFFGRVTAMGLVRVEQSQNSGWEPKRKLALIDSFDLRFFTSLLKLEVAGADLKVELWRGEQVVAAGRNGFEAQNLPVGRYLVLVESERELPDPRFQYRRLVGVDNVNLLVDDPPRQRNRGQSWTAPLTIRAPVQPGRYVGQVLIQDTQGGGVLQWFPVEVQVGLPGLAVSAMAGSLNQTGPGHVTFEVREVATGRLADVPVTIGGRRYQTTGGRVAVPLTAPTGLLTVPVVIDTPGYAYLRTTVALHVPPSWSGLPIGADPQEVGTGQRKLIETMQ